jgi:hypothetical protein
MPGSSANPRRACCSRSAHQCPRGLAWAASLSQASSACFTARPSGQAGAAAWRSAWLKAWSFRGACIKRWRPKRYCLPGKNMGRLSKSSHARKEGRRVSGARIQPGTRPNTASVSPSKSAPKGPSNEAGKRIASPATSWQRTGISPQRCSTGSRLIHTQADPVDALAKTVFIKERGRPTSSSPKPNVPAGAANARPEFARQQPRTRRRQNERLLPAGVSPTAR